MVARVALRERSGGVGERPLEPVVEVAAVRERAALDDSALVGQVEEEARLRLRPFALVEHAERTGRADHERCALARRAARARVRARGVAPERDVRDLRQPVAVDSDRGQQLLVPLARRQVEQSARRRQREARLGGAAQVVGEGDEPLGAPEDLGLVLGQPGELRRPERGMEERARACVHLICVELQCERLRGAGAARVAPAEDRRERIPVRVDGDEAVREARGRIRNVSVENTPDRGDDIVRIRALVRLPPELSVGLAVPVEVLGPD